MPFVFHPQIVRAQPRAQPRGLEQGVIPSPSETMDDASRTGNTGAYRHMLQGPVATASRLHVGFSFFQIVKHQQRSAAFAQVVNFARVASFSADAAFQMCNGRHAKFVS